MFATSTVTTKTHKANIGLSLGRKVATIRAYQIAWVKGQQVLFLRRPRFAGVLSIPCASMRKAQVSASNWLNQFTVPVVGQYPQYLQSFPS